MFLLDMDERAIAAAIILYGNDSEKRVEVLRKYKRLSTYTGILAGSEANITSIPCSGAKIFNLLFVLCISPLNYRSFERPWREDLDKHT